MPQQSAVFECHHHHHETSPLLISPNNISDSFLENNNRNTTTATNHHAEEEIGQASVVDTVLNLMKTCMGTGTLALAYACQQSGIFVFIIGLLLIMVWNVICVRLLISCLDYIPPPPLAVVAEEDTDADGIEQSPQQDEDDDDDPTLNATTTDGTTIIFPDRSLPPSPPVGTSTLGRVAWYAFGRAGLYTLDVLFVVLLLGIIVAYICAILSFMQDTPLSVSPLPDALIMGLIMTLFSLVPDLGHLSGNSGIGLSVLLATFVVIAIYGLYFPKDDDNDAGNNNMDNDDNLVVYYLPHHSWSGISHYFGIVVFGYGVVPLTYNFQSSMRQPDQMLLATRLALWVVAILYIVLGVGLYLLFPHLDADVLHELPSSSSAADNHFHQILPLLTRLAMTYTVLATAPLLIVPCAELVEGKLELWSHHYSEELSTTASASVSYASLSSSRHLRALLVRLLVVLFSVLLAIGLPGFVQVLSFVGCFCVATVSFVIPPLLHFRLVITHYYGSNTSRNHGSDAGPSKQSENGLWRMVILDILLLLWGVVATLVSTALTVS